MEKNKIETGVHYYPNHFLDLYKTKRKIPYTEKIYKHLLTLPLHPNLSKKDISYICKKVNEF